MSRSWQRDRVGAHSSVGFEGQRHTPWRERGNVPQTPRGHDAVILHNQGQKHSNAGEDMTEPSSFAKMLGIFALTSMTVKLTTLDPQPIPILASTAVGIADTCLLSVVHVPSIIAEDAATDATLNTQGIDTNPGTVIASVVEDIREEEGSKSLDSQAIGDAV